MRKKILEFNGRLQERISAALQIYEGYELDETIQIAMNRTVAEAVEAFYAAELRRCHEEGDFAGRQAILLISDEIGFDPHLH
jgi:hypothetical protein